MRPGRYAVVLSFAFSWCLALPRPTRAQPAPVPLDKLLAMPVSPGSVGLLVEHTAESSARERIAGALTDKSPETRAAAARVAFVRMLTGLRPAILQALDAEQDPAAGREMVRAAVGLGPEADLPRVVAAAARIGEGVPEVLAEQLGRSLRERAVVAAPALAPLHLPGDAWRLLLAQSTVPGVPVDDWGALALELGDAGLWAEFLGASQEDARVVDAGLLLRALNAEKADFHLATARYLMRHGKAGAENPPLKEALARARAAASPGRDSYDAATYVLAARALGEEPVQDPAVLEYVRAWTPNGDRRRGDCALWAVRQLLTGDEQQPTKSLEEFCRVDRFQGMRDRFTAGPLRTVWGLPPGLLGGVLESAGCEIGRTGMMGGRIRPHPDGRAAQVLVAPDSATAGCGSALRALLALALTPDLRLVGTELETVLVPTARDQVACMDRASFLTERGRLDAQPRPLKGGPAPFQLPPRALATLRGRLEIRSIVGESGCTSAVEVLGDAPAEAQIAAVIVALASRYEPGRRQGRPAPAERRMWIGGVVQR